MSDLETDDSSEFARRISENQARLSARLRAEYDFIVCGAGASGSVVARRLAENPNVHVLLVEAGGSDESETVFDPSRWPLNLGSQRDWGFQATPNPHLDGRTLQMSMGKGLGGGSSINVMVWARGKATGTSSRPRPVCGTIRAAPRRSSESAIKRDRLHDGLAKNLVHRELLLF